MSDADEINEIIIFLCWIIEYNVVRNSNFKLNYYDRQNVLSVDT